MPVGPLGWLGAKPSLPASLGPSGRGCRSLGAREATCLLTLRSLEGLKDRFQCWQDLRKVLDERPGCPAATSQGLADIGCQAHT